MSVNGMTCLGSSTLKSATTPVPPSIKLGWNGFTTKIAVGGEWEVASITNPMIMSFDGMTHFLHQRLMKFQRKFQLHGLMKHASHLTIKKVVKNIKKSGVQNHCIPLVTFVQLTTLDLVEKSQAFRCRSPGCFQ